MSHLKPRAVVACRGGRYCNLSQLVHYHYKRNPRTLKQDKQSICHSIPLRDQILETNKWWPPKSISMMAFRMRGAMKILGGHLKEILTIAWRNRRISRELVCLGDWLRRGMIRRVELGQKIVYMNLRRARFCETMQVMKQQADRSLRRKWKPKWYPPLKK